MIPPNVKLEWECTIEERTQGVIGCWIEDCFEGGDPPDLSQEQLEMLIHQVEVAISAERTEIHVETE